MTALSEDLVAENRVLVSEMGKAEGRFIMKQDQQQLTRYDRSRPKANNLDNTGGAFNSKRSVKLPQIVS